MIVRATSAAGFPGGTLTVHFDPSVAAAVVARPVLTDGNGVAEAHIEGDRAIITLPASPDATGTRAIAEITLRGIGAGRTALTLDPVVMDGTTVTLSQSVVDVK